MATTRAVDLRDDDEGQLPGLGILDMLIRQSDQIYDQAVAVANADGHRLVATVVMFSGGNDSTTVAHLFRNRATYAGMSNTGIGIEQTRQYVRDTCGLWGLPLIEKHPRPGRTYRDMVLGKVTATYGPNKGRVISSGFPGGPMHPMMYHWLKERPFNDLRADLVKNARRERVIFISGIRAPESYKRRSARPVEREGAIVWCKPLLNWSRLDLNSYRKRFPDMPRNEVSDTLHMSGECLCGANAHPGELDEIEYWYPDVAAGIHALEAEVKAAGIARSTWGGGSGTPCAGACNV